MYVYAREGIIRIFNSTLSIYLPLLVSFERGSTFFLFCIEMHTRVWNGDLLTIVTQVDDGQLG